MRETDKTDVRAYVKTFAVFFSLFREHTYTYSHWHGNALPCPSLTKKFDIKMTMQSFIVLFMSLFGNEQAL